MLPGGQRQLGWVMAPKGALHIFAEILASPVGVHRNLLQLLLEPGGIFGLHAQPDPGVLLGHRLRGDTEVVGGGVSVPMEPLHRAGVKEACPPLASNSRSTARTHSMAT